MKLGYTFYFCGIGLLLLGITLIVMIIVDPRGAPIGYAIGRIIFSFLLGLWWMRIGANKIARARLEHPELEQMKQMKHLAAFRKENCIGCRFADEEVLGKPVEEVAQYQGWCIRPELPQGDSEYCYSRERKQNLEEATMPQETEVGDNQDE